MFATFDSEIVRTKVQICDRSIELKRLKLLERMHTPDYSALFHEVVIFLSNLISISTA